MVRLGYAVAAVLLVTAYFLLSPARAVFEALLGFLAVGGIEYGVRRYRPERAGAWHCLAVALALLAAGDTIFAVLNDRTNGDVPARPRPTPSTWPPTCR